LRQLPAPLLTHLGHESPLFVATHATSHSKTCYN
jgi:hypothetical protein